ncbi:hypothetical protein, conserved, partial [Eimeria tenella]
VDPRIHFAVSFGCVSSPPIRIYHAETLDEELALATRAFLSSSSNFCIFEKTVFLSSIFKWFEGDFGSSKKEVLTFLLPYLEAPQSELLQQLLEEDEPAAHPAAASSSSSSSSGSSVTEVLMGGFRRLFGGLRVSYLPYNWQMRFTTHKPYDPSQHIL